MGSFIYYFEITNLQKIKINFPQIPKNMLKYYQLINKKRKIKNGIQKSPPPTKIADKANKHNAFTLSEVLITLVIIGIVAAITVPILMHQYRWKQYRTGLMKARSTLDQATIKYALENGENPECGYWTKNPYKNNGCTDVCKGYDSNGNCTGWMCKETGGKLPSDYNGNFGDCYALYNFYKKALNVVKICESNAYKNGCIPDYEGNDTVYKSKNDGSSDEDANKATSGCGKWHKAEIKAGKAIVTADGMIFFPYGSFGSPIMAVDINGQAGPNKWGYDVFAFEGRMTDKYSVPTFTPGGCSFTEKGGVSGTQLLYGKNYM